MEFFYHDQHCASYSGTLNCPGLILPGTRDTDLLFRDSASHSRTVGHPTLKYDFSYSCAAGDNPSVIWHYWLGGRTGIWPVKKLSGDILAWLSVWSEVQIICICTSWCHCHPIISCYRKIRNGLPFRCRLTQAVLEKRPLNGCSSSSSSSCSCAAGDKISMDSTHCAVCPR